MKPRFRCHTSLIDPWALRLQVKRMANSCGNPAIGNDKDSHDQKQPIFIVSEKVVNKTQGFHDFYVFLFYPSTCFFFFTPKLPEFCLSFFFHGFQETKFCNVDKACEVAKDCLYTGWSSWSVCSASCVGITMRRRNIASYGTSTGLFCLGTQSCTKMLEVSLRTGEMGILNYATNDIGYICGKALWYMLIQSP